MKKLMVIFLSVSLGIVIALIILSIIRYQLSVWKTLLQILYIYLSFVQFPIIQYDIRNLKISKNT